MTEGISTTEPGTGIYVLAWVLAKIAAVVVSNIVLFIAFNDLVTQDDFMNRLMLVMPFSIVLVAAAMVGIYALFPGIRIVKVIPYLWGLGALGVLVTCVQTFSSGVTYPVLYYILVLLEFGLAMLAVTWGFRRMGRL